MKKGREEEGRGGRVGEGKIKSEREKVKSDEGGSHGNPSQHCVPSWTWSTDRAWRPQSI